MITKWIVCSSINAEEISNMDFLSINPIWKVFQCEQSECEYCVVYKNQTYFITGTEFREVRQPEFQIDESVTIKASNKQVEIIEIFWHYQKNEPFYLVACNGKQSRRRYYGHEFIKL